MDKRAWIFILFLIVIIIGLITLKYYASKPQENFAMVDICSKGIATIIKRSMGLEDGDNSLPAELLAAKCISVSDFRKMTESGLMSKSSVLTTLNNLFQEKDNPNVPYIDKFYKWEIPDNQGVSKPVDWSEKLDSQKTDILLKLVIIPLIINLRTIFKDIVSSTEMATKYGAAANSANRAFINGFLAKYADFDEASGERFKQLGTEENAMFDALTKNSGALDGVPGYASIISSNNLYNAMKLFAYAYLLKVDFNASAQCNISIFDTQADNDIKLYVRLKELLGIWRNMKKKSNVAFTSVDLNSSVFQTDGDYSKSEIIKYFTVELKKPNPTPTTITNEAYVAQVMNKMINDAFITDGGMNDGRLISDPECKSDVGKLLCNIRLVDEKICKPNMDACVGSGDFNQYCTAVGEILKSAKDSNAKYPDLDLTKLPTTPINTSSAAGTTNTTAGSGLAASVKTTTTTAASGTTPPSGSGGLPGAAASSGAGAPLAASAGGSGSGSASNQALQAKLGQYSIPAYLDRSTQELLVFVYDKLSASYNFDDDDVPDDIKQAISQLPPSGKANICNRYCALTVRCNGICKLAGCMNCQVGTGAQAGSDAEGEPSSSLGYAGVDDDYNLLGFLDDISQSKLISGTGSMVASSGNGVQDQYKHMGPMISQKDTSGVSNIFAPYIIMAPKKDGAAYGAYLLDDPNDPNYRQYIDDLVKSY